MDIFGSQFHRAGGETIAEGRAVGKRIGSGEVNMVS